MLTVKQRKLNTKLTFDMSDLFIQIIAGIYWYKILASNKEIMNQIKNYFKKPFSFKFEASGKH